jgi:uncharacterized protein (DUF1778 family)
MSATTRHGRLNFRLQRDQKSLIEKAAAVSGQSVSDFAVSSMLRAAQETIQSAATTRLSLRDGEVFLRMLESDAEPNAALKRAAGRYRKRRA